VDVCVSGLPHACVCVGGCRRSCIVYVCRAGVVATLRVCGWVWMPCTHVCPGVAVVFAALQAPHMAESGSESDLVISLAGTPRAVGTPFRRVKQACGGCARAAAPARLHVTLSSIRLPSRPCAAACAGLPDLQRLIAEEAANRQVAVSSCLQSSSEALTAATLRLSEELSREVATLRAECAGRAHHRGGGASPGTAAHRSPEVEVASPGAAVGPAGAAAAASAPSPAWGGGDGGDGGGGSGGELAPPPPPPTPPEGVPLAQPAAARSGVGGAQFGDDSFGVGSP
jgi:hypothetical protein